MVGMFQRDVLQPFEFCDGAVADDLYLGLVRDGFEIWVQDGFRLSLAMAVGFDRGVEHLRQVVLGSGGEGLLVFEEHELVLVEGFLDDFEVGLGEVFKIGAVDFGAEVDGGALGRGEFLDRDFALDDHCG